MIGQFQILHTYQQLVKEGKASALKCPNCHVNYHVGIDANEDPLLKCYVCQTDVRLGIRTWGQIRAVVSEHYILEEDN